MVLPGGCRSEARERGWAAYAVGTLKGNGKTEGKQQSFHSRSGEEGVLILPQGAADSEKSALGSPWKENPGDAVKPERVYGEGRTLKMTQPFL